MPLLLGGFLELPLGVLAGDGRRRRLAILGGGILFVLTLLGVASARSFAVLLAAFIAFYPASGAFVSLTQAEIMDAWPDRQARLMARWDLAGSAGALGGPLLPTVVLAAGGGWRAGFLALAAISGLTWLGAYLRRAPGPAAVTPAAAASPDAAGASQPWTERARETIAALRTWRTLRWLLPGRSSVAVTLSSAAGLAGGLGPLAVGLAAQGLGLSWALAGLVFVPVAVLILPGRE